jgi:hypothetical protein
MRKTMRFSSIALAIAMTGGLLLGLAPNASAQRFRTRVFIGVPGPYFGPFYPYYGYYPYPPYYMAANYGEIKFDTHEKYADVYIDGGFAGRLKDTKKFALPGAAAFDLKAGRVSEVQFHGLVCIKARSRTFFPSASA